MKSKAARKASAAKVASGKPAPKAETKATLAVAMAPKGSTRPADKVYGAQQHKITAKIAAKARFKG